MAGKGPHEEKISTLKEPVSEKAGEEQGGGGEEQVQTRQSSKRLGTSEKGDVSQRGWSRRSRGREAQDEMGWGRGQARQGLVLPTERCDVIL